MTVIDRHDTGLRIAVDNLTNESICVSLSLLIPIAVKCPLSKSFCNTRGRLITAHLQNVCVCKDHNTTLKYFCMNHGDQMVFFFNLKSS